MFNLYLSSNIGLLGDDREVPEAGTPLFLKVVVQRDLCMLANLNQAALPLSSGPARRFVNVHTIRIGNERTGSVQEPMGTSARLEMALPGYVMVFAESFVATDLRQWPEKKASRSKQSRKYESWR